MPIMQEPEQGLVIVDSSVAYRLVLPIQNAYLSKRPNDYAHDACWTESLFLLANYGFKIAIPEMVAFETAQMIANGKGPDMLFTDTSSTKISSTHLAPRAFFRRVLNENNPNIAIEQPDRVATSDAAEFIREANFILNADFKQPQALGQARVAMTSLRHKNKKNFGDMAAVDIIKSLPKNWKKPIFYLCDDGDAYANLIKARPDLKIGMVNLKGYLAALENNELFRVLGIKDEQARGKTIDEIGEELRTAHNVLRNRGATSIDAPRPATDSSMGIGRPFDFLFSNAVAQIKDRIIADYVAPVEEPVVDERVAAAQADLQKKKWEKFKPRKTGSDSDIAGSNGGASPSAGDGVGR